MIVIMQSLAVEDESICVLRIKADCMETAEAVGWFLVQCGCDVAIVMFCSGVQEVNLLVGIFKSQVDGWVEVMKVLVDFFTETPSHVST